MRPVKVSIIIVSFNTKELLRNCLRSIYENTRDIEFEVIISDNNSNDGTLAMLKSEFPRVIYVANNENLGFGAGNNRGLDVAKGECVLFLNSDTLLLNNAVKLFYECWENREPGVAAMGTNLVDGSGHITESYGNFPNTSSLLKNMLHHFIAFYVKNVMKIFCLDISKLRPNPMYLHRVGTVDYVTGADLFMANDESARFDENFFLYFEETDIQWRLRKKGKRSVLVDGPRISHLIRGGRLAENDDVLRFGSFSIIQSEISRVRYAKKNLSRLTAFLLKIMISAQWLSPYILKNTIPFFKPLWKI